MRGGRGVARGAGRSGRGRSRKREVKDNKDNEDDDEAFAKPRGNIVRCC